jgi:hypothetical protein
MGVGTGKEDRIMRLAIKSITTIMVLAGLLVAASCVSAEQKTPSDVAVSKLSPQVNQPSKVRVTVCGKEILNELEGKIKELRKAGVAIEKDVDVLVLKSDQMADELTELLERARALMSKHPGRIEIVRSNGRAFVAEVKGRTHILGDDYLSKLPADVPYFFERQMPLLGSTYKTSLGGPRAMLGRYHYAYAEEDRQHAATLDRECSDLARQYVRTSDPAERDKLAAKLKANLNELFDMKLKGYTAKMGAIERELETLRKKVEERKSNKELIVTGRFKELVGEDNPLRW